MSALQRRPRVVADEDEDEVKSRPRQRQRRNESDVEVEADTPEASGDEGQDQQNAATDHAQLVKKLVRYALACDYSRTAIRRDGIREKVLGSHGRTFRKVFDDAQLQLQMVFGMEMVELPTRDKDTMSLTEKRKAVKSAAKGSQTSNAYILRTLLPDAYRSTEIIAPSRIQSAEDEAAFVGIYTLLIAIIVLNGGSLSDAKLRRNLTRLNASDNMPGDKTENVLQTLARQGYIAKTIEKRQDGDEDSITWSVGPRGKLEVGPEAIAGVVRAVYGDAAEGLERKLQASLGLQDDEQEINGTPNNVNGYVDREMSDAPAASRANGSRGSTLRQSRRADDDDDD